MDTVKHATVRRTEGTVVMSATSVRVMMGGAREREQGLSMVRLTYGMGMIEDGSKGRSMYGMGIIRIDIRMLGLRGKDRRGVTAEAQTFQDRDIKVHLSLMERKNSLKDQQGKAEVLKSWRLRRKG
jgi:hypothetical protein